MSKHKPSWWIHASQTQNGITRVNMCKSKQKKTWKEPFPWMIQHQIFSTQTRALHSPLQLKALWGAPSCLSSLILHRGHWFPGSQSPFYVEGSRRAQPRCHHSRLLCPLAFVRRGGGAEWRTRARTFSVIHAYMCMRADAHATRDAHRYVYVKF